MLRRGISPMLRAEIYARDRYICWLCGIEVVHKKVPKHYRATLDHIIHKKDGGENTTSNLKTCCHRCNQYRGDSKVAFNQKYRNRYMRTKVRKIRKVRELQEDTYLHSLAALREWQVICDAVYGQKVFAQETSTWEKDIKNINQETLRQRSVFCLDAVDEIHAIFVRDYGNNTDPRMFIK